MCAEKSKVPVLERPTSASIRLSLSERGELVTLGAGSGQTVMQVKKSHHKEIDD